MNSVLHTRGAQRVTALLRFIPLVSVAAVLASTASAQIAGSGTITGRIINPTTGEYVRNAEVRIESTGQSVVSESGGGYRLTQVPPGEVTLRVTYIGSVPVTMRVTVPPGGTTSRSMAASPSPSRKAGTAREAGIRSSTPTVRPSMASRSRPIARISRARTGGSRRLAAATGMTGRTTPRR